MDFYRQLVTGFFKNIIEIAILCKKHLGNLDYSVLLTHFHFRRCSVMKNYGKNGNVVGDCQKSSKYIYHPKKMLLLQELYEDNLDRKIQYCETMFDLVNAIPVLLPHISFSNECSFFLNVNKQNCRYWRDENLQELICERYS